MKSNRNLRRLAALLLVIFLAMLAVGPAPAAQAGSRNTNPSVIPPDAMPYGYSYREWGASFVQWWLSIPAAENPVFDQTGEFCGVGQSGPVWYLMGNVGGTDERTCTIPLGKGILVTVDVVECSYVEPPESGFHGDNEAEMRDCANNWGDLMTVDEVAVDGVPITDLLPRYRFDTPLYTVAYPEGNMFGVEGSGTTESVGDGVFFMLAPLSAGEHTLYMRSGFSGMFEGEVTYHLTVAR